MTERTHNEIYDRLGRLDAEVKALRSFLEKETDLSKRERKEIMERVKSLELINAERIGAETARGQYTVWLFRVIKWTLPYVPVGAVAAFVLWISDKWPWGAP